MSGPITRRYGFPNFDKIFGPKPVLHGADDEPPKAGGGEAKVEATGEEREGPREEPSGGTDGKAR